MYVGAQPWHIEAKGLQVSNWEPTKGVMNFCLPLCPMQRIERISSSISWVELKVSFRLVVFQICLT